MPSYGCVRKIWVEPHHQIPEKALFIKVKKVAKQGAAKIQTNILHTGATLLHLLLANVTDVRANAFGG